MEKWSQSEIELSDFDNLHTSVCLSHDEEHIFVAHTYVDPYAYLRLSTDKISFDASLYLTDLFVQRWAKENSIILPTVIVNFIYNCMGPLQLWSTLNSKLILNLNL